MEGLLILISSFILSIVVRKIAIKHEECKVARFLPQVIIIVGGLYGGYIFLLENWSIYFINN